MRSFARRFARPAALFASLCLHALVAPCAAAQEARPTQTPPPEDGEEVVRVTTELVQTDVMVFDKQGKFVDGLKADQFELKVDGKPQAVTFFERVKAGAVDEDAQLAAARGGATRREGDRSGAVLPLDRGRTVFFFVDDIHMSPGSLARVQKTLLKFIEEELGQNDEAAVISATGQPGFLQQLTDEKAVLRAAVARLKPRNFITRDLQAPPMTVAQALAIDRNDSMVLGFFVDALAREMPAASSRATLEQMVSQRARSLIQQSNHYNDNTLATLENLVRGSAPLPGRKLVFFISDGFLLDTRESGSRGRMQSVTDAAARSGVVIYSLGAQGLTSGMADASTETAFDPSGRLVSTDLSELRGTQEPLHTLAADTGGRALVNTNSLEASVEKALAETAVYYLLAWRPEGVEASAPKFRRIEASVKGRDDLRVIVRKGFYDTPPAEAAAAKKNAKKQPAPTPTPQPPAPDKELLEALRSRHPRASFPTSLALGYVSTPPQGATLTASVGIDRELLARLAPAAKEGGARVDVAGAVYNDKGDALSAFKQELAVRPAESADGGRHTILYTHPFRLAPGLYQVRVAALERQTGRAGSASQWVEVPALDQRKFAMSSLFIGERPAPGAASANPVPGAEGSGVLMSVDGRFARNSAMRFITYVYNATGGGSAPPDVALQVQMFRDDQPVFTAPLIKVKTEGVPDLTRIPYAAEVSLASFPPGRYLLQITAIDRLAKASSTRRVKFVIE